jgi:hypothetical protein
MTPTSLTLLDVEYSSTYLGRFIRMAINKIFCLMGFPCFGMQRPLYDYFSNNNWATASYPQRFAAIVSEGSYGASQTSVLTRIGNYFENVKFSKDLPKGPALPTCHCFGQ